MPAFAALLAAVAVLMATAPAGADTQLGDTGKVGRHRLRDSRATPGVVCQYSARGFLTGIRVKPPVVHARNVSRGRDRQTVSWQFRIEYWDVNDFWAEMFTVSRVLRTAWDDTPAAFTARTITGDYTALGARYRVIVIMAWHRGGAVEGRANHLADFYLQVRPGPDATVGPAGYCPAAVGAG
jgi:hypothetical protein